MTAIATTQRPYGQRSAVARGPRPARRRRRNVLLRRRIAALLVIALVSLAVSGLWAMRSEASSDAGPLEATVVVAPGETVWEIANEYVPAGDHPQAYVARVLRYNNLDAAAVQPGMVLRLPRD